MEIKDLFDPKDTQAEQFVKLVKSDLEDIKHSFFTIGFRLNEANQYRYYRELGYENISECAEDLFGFKKTTTYDLIEIYQRFHDPKAKKFLLKEYDQFSQSQLKVMAQLRWAVGDFRKYARPEDTVETIKQAKSLWNKLYDRGSSPHSRGDFKTLPEFLDKFSDYTWTASSKKMPEQKEEKKELQNSGYAENLIETTAVESEPQGEDPAEQSANFSAYTEKFGEFSKEAILHFLKVMEFSIGFGGDKKTPSTRVVPSFFTEEILKALARAIEKDRTKVKRIITNFIIENVGKYPYEIKLYDRAQAFSIFAGVLAGHITDYLIQELKGEKK